MSWLSEIFSPNDPKTIGQDLELLVARWTDRSRKGKDTLTQAEIAEALRKKAQEIAPIEPPSPPPGRSRPFKKG